MKTKERLEIEDFLCSLQPNFDILSYVEVDQIDQNNPFWSIYNMLEQSDYFYENVDYYCSPWKYMLKHIFEIVKYPKLAKKYGYKLKDLDLSTFVNLLATENNKKNFLALKSQIDQFFA